MHYTFDYLAAIAYPRFATFKQAVSQGWEIGEQSQIVHIEFQTRDDMNFRMAEYFLMLT